MMMPIFPILTDRLELRRFSRDDLKDFQAYRSDLELSRYQGWEPTSDDDARTFLDNQSVQAFGSEGQWLQIAVTCRKSKRLIGDFGVCVSDSKRGIATMGFTISRPFQRNGYASEAAHGILSRLFETNEINDVVCETDARNNGAIMLLQRLGFTLTKTNATIFRSETCMEHTFAMSAMQWCTHEAR